MLAPGKGDVLMGRLDPEEIGLHSLRPKHGSRKAPKRLGRGKGSGTGKTAGRGHKGYGARSGSKRKVAYEGGQNLSSRGAEDARRHEEAVDADRASHHAAP